MKSKNYDWSNPTHRRLYRIWAGMKARCSAKCGKQGYANYSSRGIKVCKEWGDDQAVESGKRGCDKARDKDCDKAVTTILLSRDNIFIVTPVVTPIVTQLKL